MEIDSGLNANLSALRALSVGQAVTANNLANVSTEGFEASRAVYASGPEGQGVQVAAVLPQGSGTDISRETVQMIADENAYSANAVAAASFGETLGALLDLKV
ncbi:MAG: flagellar basal body protein [Desulfovibrionaceae bacterium]